MTINISQEQKDYARKLSNKIYEDKKSFGDRGKHAQKGEDKRITYIGFLGEVIYADENNLERPELIQGENDKGYDFKKQGETVEIKTSENGKDLIFFPDEKEELADRLVRIYIKNNDEAEITLDISSEKFLEECETKNLGYGKRLYLSADE